MIHLNPAQLAKSFHGEEALLFLLVGFVSFSALKNICTEAALLLCQAAGQELMLTAPLTRAALLKLTGRPSITKCLMQPVKGLLGAKRGVRRDSE